MPGSIYNNAIIEHSVIEARLLLLGFLRRASGSQKLKGAAAEGSVLPRCWHLGRRKISVGLSHFCGELSLIERSYFSFGHGAVSAVFMTIFYFWRSYI